MILTTPYDYVIMFLFLCQVSHHIASSFHNHDISAYCQPHSGSAVYTFFIVSIFIFVLQWWVSDSAAGLCTALPLTMIVYRLG